MEYHGLIDGNLAYQTITDDYTVVKSKNTELIYLQDMIARRELSNLKQSEIETFVNEAFKKFV